MKRVLRPLIVVAVIVLLGLWFVRHVKSTLNKPPAPPQTVAARTGDIAVVVQETGTIQPVDKVDVRSKVAGRLLSVPIEEGQLVHAGQLIATVDRTLIDPQITQTQAQVNSARDRLQQVIAAYALQQEQTKMAIAEADASLKASKTHLAVVAAPARPQEVSQQEQTVARAKISLDDAKRTLTRKQTLVARGFVPQSDVDTAQVAVDTAQSTLLAAQQALSLTNAGPREQDVNDARSQVNSAHVQLDAANANKLQDDVKKSDIAQARASLQQIVGNLDQLEVQAHDTTIVAPAAGVVLKKYRQVGEIVQSATTGFSDQQSIVATLGSRLEVRVDINEVDIARLHVGAPVTIQVDAVPNATFTGKVTVVAPASTSAFSDTSSGSSSSATSGISKFAVRIAIGKYDARLRPGMSANVTIRSDSRKNVVLIPRSAVPFSGTSGPISVLLPGGKQEKRTVSVGLRNDTDVEVTNGLKAGDKVVLESAGDHRRTIEINGD